MTSIVRVHRKGQMTLPSAMRSEIGIADGDLMEATISRGKIVLTPKRTVESCGSPDAEDEYSPEQRMAIDAILREAEKGPFFGPYNSSREMMADIAARAKTAKPKKQKRR